MAVETALINLAINIIINVIVLSPVLWISGRLIAGKDKAKFTDALWIVLLGTLIGLGFNYFLAESLGSITGIIASIIMLLIWLGLVKHFFDCGWLKALAISILTVIIFIVIVVLLAIIGIGIALIGF
jgi:predicted lysophospholipase L1 biosynthesis ABC-type transport system permease subunit